MPGVSIILPFKNAARWLCETVESIKAQTYTDWELIAVDDFSQDASLALMQTLAQADPRIRVLTNHTPGIIPALQTALNAAQGQYITRMDADDRMPSRRLAAFVSCMESAPPKTVVTGKVRYFSDSEVSKGYRSYERWLNARIEQQDHFDHIYRECVVASPNWLMRTSELKDSRIFDALTYPEDYDLCFRWMSNGFKIHSLNLITLLWREHPDRTSRHSATYAQKSFFRLKLHWFVRNHPQTSSIGIVGMGQKGKLCAALLQEFGAPFQLYDLHPERYNQSLFLKPVLDPTRINDPVILVARYPDPVDELQEYIERMGYRFGKTAFWV